MFGRDEKLKFPSEIPYHKEVCVNDSAEFLHLELVIPFFPNDKVLFDLTSWSHQMKHLHSGSTQKG